MASVNKVIIIGNLGRGPGDALHARAATRSPTSASRPPTTWKDKASGEKKEATEWHRIAFFGKLAEIAGEYLKKGSQVYVEGRLRTRKWQDKDGQDRYTHRDRRRRHADARLARAAASRATNAQERDGGEREGRQRRRRRREAGGEEAGGKFDDMEDDIPF